MKSNWLPFPGDLPDAQIFVLGDIHGRDDALALALEQIAQIPRHGKARHLVSLGDVIDRGPKGVAAMDRLVKAEGFDDVTLLPGNHELMLLDGVEEKYIDFWYKAGGHAVIDELDPKGHWKTEDEARLGVAVALEDHLKRIRTGPTHMWFGDLLCVHAGIWPSANRDAREAFLAQSRRHSSRKHWAWIREEFLGARGGWDPEGRIVVAHGHTTAVKRPVSIDDWLKASDLVAFNRRINLDACAAAFEQVGWAEFRGGDTPEYRIGLARLAPILDE